MEKSQMPHILKLCLIAILFLITPFVWPSMRPPYLYFLLNLLIIALGAEAGFLSFLKPQDDKKPAPYAPKPFELPTKFVIEESNGNISAKVNVIKEVDAVINNDPPPAVVQKTVRKVEKSVSEKIVSSVKVRTLKKCPSTPSIFFIGGGDEEEEEVMDGLEEEVEGVLSKQELFTKAETFIGNFYNQLKMQREDSWRKIHGLYNKAF
ncbi:hypothetical protein ACHQM5_002773 [Ranunculus cassubicifolius]